MTDVSEVSVGAAFGDAHERAFHAARNVWESDLPLIARLPIALVVGAFTYVVWLAVALAIAGAALVGVVMAYHGIKGAGEAGVGVLQQSLGVAEQHLSGWPLWSTLFTIGAAVFVFVAKSRKALHLVEYIYDLVRWHTGHAALPPAEAAFHREADRLGYTVKKRAT